MIGRRKSPDGLPFRLYERMGKFTYSIGYKLRSGEWEFRLSAPANDAVKIAQAREEAIARANVLNGIVVKANTTSSLINDYFAWQEGLPPDSEDRKADSTLKENKQERKWLDTAFGAMAPETIKASHVYAFLKARAKGAPGKHKPAPAKANKEIALLSAILEFGRTEGRLEANPCRGIKYNKTRPNQKYTPHVHVEFALAMARETGGAALRLALCVMAAYITVSRPIEMRTLERRGVLPEGIKIRVGKRKRGHSVKHKLIEYSPELRAVIQEALTLQATPSMLVFGNMHGQEYTRSGWNTLWTRHMVFCESRAAEEGIEFARFSLADMRPAAVTDRMEGGDAQILNATGHVDGRMVGQVYDRRATKVAKPTK
jgi:integrase